MAAVMSDGEKNDILIEAQKGTPIREIARMFGRDFATVTKLLKGLKSSTTLARAMVAARSAELVARVLEKADVDQAIDILQRANVGVLEPLAKGGGGGGNHVGILVSVSPGSLPAVDSTVYTDGQRQLQQETDSVSARAVRVGGVNLGQFAGDNEL